MVFHVVNKDLYVNEIQVRTVSSSSLLLIGDAETIQLASKFDTPPESFIIGPFVPLKVGR